MRNVVQQSRLQLYQDLREDRVEEEDEPGGSTEHPLCQRGFGQLRLCFCGSTLILAISHAEILACSVLI